MLILGVGVNVTIVQVVQVGSIGVQLVQGVGSLEVSVTGDPRGGFPVAVAKLSTWPASISAWVIMWTAVNAVELEAPTARVANEPVTVALISVTVMLVRVTLPVLVTTKLYTTVSPMLVIPSLLLST